MPIAGKYLLLALAGAAVLGLGTIASGQSGPGGLHSNLRGNTPLPVEGPAPRLLPQANTASARCATTLSSRR